MPLLVPVEDGDAASYTAIVAAKRGPRRTRLRNIANQVNARYAAYSAWIPNLVNLAPSPFRQLRARDVRNCYTVQTKAMDQLRKKVMDNLPANKAVYCQYCLIDTMDDLDHYVPKTLFPEYSVF